MDTLPLTTGDLVVSEDLKLIIPQHVVALYQWQPGQTLGYLTKGKGILIMPIPTFDELRGIAIGADTTNYRERGEP